MFKHF